MRTSICSWIFSISLALSFFLVSSTCLEDQKSLLLQLKNSLQFNSSGNEKLVGWDQSSNCCLWEGVSCDASGQVTGLDLTNKSISGGIESLFSLKNLQSLNLSYNKFNSTIPPQLAQLTSLKFLNVSYAGFRGQIPVEVSKMTWLVSLDFSVFDSYFHGIPMLQLKNPNLIELVENLSELEELYADGISISENGTDWWSELSSSLPKLRVLSLSHCDLSGPIDSSLSKLQFLSVIRLDGNNFSASVPDFFAGFRNLNSLHLSSSGLFREFPEKIFQVSTLQTIDIADNKVLKGSLPEFPSNSSLQTLKLSGTNFSGMLPNSIGNLKMLSRIDLAGCNFSGSIPESMENLTQLVYLDISSNGLNGTIPSFSLSKNLTQIDLSGNRLSGQIASDWRGLQKLVSLDLGNNALSGTIPESLFSLPSLQKIQLSNNLFSGQLNDPNASDSSHLLDTIDLSSNHLEGPIPMSVFGLKSLKFLSLSSNNFNGSIQLDVIQQLKKLSYLDLSHNSLSIGYNGTDPTLSFPKIATFKLASCNLRSFPEFLKSQSKLEHLDLSMNQIQGDVPSWIWSLGLAHLNLSFNLLTDLEGHVGNSSSTLRVLDLHSNQLQGPIRILPHSAFYLDYSSNNISSVIPNEIGTSLSFAMFLSLSSNNFHGEIPESICNGSYLLVLDLSNNSLSGQIPKCLMAMRTLGVLNLRRNKLIGTIPDKFTGDCLLETLDLNGNKLEGKIPRSLANCTSLEVLNLGNNRINDIFPCHLKNRTISLRVLVLRSNNFQGRIGCPWINATWQKLQIVDLASNNFSGNLPTECLKTWEAMTIKEDLTKSDFSRIQFSFLGLSNLYYQDTVTVTSKGQEMELVKILTIFTSIDLSCNKIIGPIPEMLHYFNALYALNLSHNALTGGIPSALGNLSYLESLDLSVNKLNGTIPKQLAQLTFLSFLNLSHNNLVGKIPPGAQLQTFGESSFEGNEGVCGPPVRAKCLGSSPRSSPTTTIDPEEEAGAEFDWRFIYTGIGFGVGSALVVAPLVFCRECRIWCDDLVDQILLTVLPLVGLKYTTWQDQEDEEEECSDEDEEDDDDATSCGQSQQESEQCGYCVFCTKLDISRKRAIHNPTCICHH